MDATRVLREEHQLILKVLNSFEPALTRARASKSVLRSEFEPFIEFFRGFADRCHHGKEEDRLFPCLQRCGLPGDCGPIAVMLEEHRQGRFHVRSMAELLPAAETGKTDAVEAFLQHGTAFLNLLRDHIAKEDHVLFQMANQMIQGEQLSQLKAAFVEVAQDRDYDCTYHKCRGIADRIASGGSGTDT